VWPSHGQWVCAPHLCGRVRWAPVCACAPVASASQPPSRPVSAGAPASAVSQPPSRPVSAGASVSAVSQPPSRPVSAGAPTSAVRQPPSRPISAGASVSAVSQPPSRPVSAGASVAPVSQPSHGQRARVPFFCGGLAGWGRVCRAPVRAGFSVASVSQQAPRPVNAGAPVSPVSRLPPPAPPSSPCWQWVFGGDGRGPCALCTARVPHVCTSGASGGAP
jgi:hypothetical protein